MPSNYNYACLSNAILLEKFFGNVEVTVIIKERQKNDEKDAKQQDALNVLIDELGIVLNDPEIEELFKSLPQKTKSRQDKKS